MKKTIKKLNLEVLKALEIQKDKQKNVKGGNGGRKMRHRRAHT